MASLCALSELAGHWEEPPQAAGFLSSSQRGTVDLPCTPGPAYYGRREPAYRVALGDASFRSGLSRLEGLKTTAEGPGPGSYDTPRPQRRSLPLRSAARTRSLRERTHRQEETALAAADLCACGRKAGQGHGAITASLAVPKSPGKHVVPPKRMKSLLGNETVAFRDKADEVFMWIGSNSQEVPSPRRRFPGKVSGRTSAFASGTERQTSPRERQGTPSPGDYATVGFAEKLASRLCGPGSKVPFDSSQDSGEACEALSTSLGRVHHPARGAMSQTCRTPRQFDLHRLSSTVRSALEIGCHVAHPGLAITRRQHILLGWMRWRRRRLSQSAPHLLPSEVAKSVSVLSLQRPMHPERWR